MPNIWFCSDWHLCHSKPFIYEDRGFKSVEDMNEAIIKRHNSVVDWEDDVYFLGDAMLNDNVEGLKCLKQLKGKIHMIRGNHDTDSRIELYKSCFNVVEVCDGKFLKANGYSFYLSHYPCLTSNCDEDKPLNRRVINICGHTHTTDPLGDLNKGLIYHVDMDGHECYPTSLNEVIGNIKIALSNK